MWFVAMWFHGKPKWRTRRHLKIISDYALDSLSYKASDQKNVFTWKHGMFLILSYSFPKMLKIVLNDLIVVVRCWIIGLAGISCHSMHHNIFTLCVSDIPSNWLFILNKAKIIKSIYRIIQDIDMRL